VELNNYDVFRQQTLIYWGVFPLFLYHNYEQYLIANSVVQINELPACFNYLSLSIIQFFTPSNYPTTIEAN